MATSSASLNVSPRENWVEKSGSLPPGIRKVARALKQRYPAWPLSRCIAVAISRSKVWAAGGSAKGARNTAQWEALRARNAARTATSMARDGADAVEFAGHKPCRYRHGWIPLRPGVPDRRGPKARGDGPAPEAPSAKPKRSGPKTAGPKSTGSKPRASKPMARRSDAELMRMVAVARQKPNAKPGVIRRLLDAVKRAIASRRAAAARKAATEMARTTDPTGDIEMAAKPAFGGKTPTRGDVKKMVAASKKVPDALKPKYKARVMGHARRCGAEDCVPNDWRNSATPGAPSATTKKKTVPPQFKK